MYDKSKNTMADKKELQRKLVEEYVKTLFEVTACTNSQCSKEVDAQSKASVKATAKWKESSKNMAQAEMIQAWLKNGQQQMTESPEAKKLMRCQCTKCVAVVSKHLEALLANSEFNCQKAKKNKESLDCKVIEPVKTFLASKKEADYARVKRTQLGAQGGKRKASK